MCFTSCFLINKINNLTNTLVMQTVNFVDKLTNNKNI